MDEKPLTPAELYSKHLRMQFPGQFPTDLSVVLRILEQSSWDYEWKDGELIDKSPEDCPYVMTEEGWSHFRLSGANRPPVSWHPPHKDSALLAIPDDAAKHWLSFIGFQLSYVIKWDKEEINRWIGCYYGFQGGLGVKDSIERNRIAFAQVQAAAIQIRRRINFLEMAEWKAKNPTPEKICVGSWVRSKTGSVFSVVQEIDGVVGGKIGPIARLDPPLEHPVFGTKAWWAFEMLALLEKNQCPRCGADLTGDPIPEDARKSYGGATHWSRRISHVSSDQDCTVEYECPDCNGRWPVMKEANQ